LNVGVPPRDSMNVSARLSSSARVTPGAACSSTRSSVAATTRPARSLPEPVEQPVELGRNLLARPRGVEVRDEPAAAVVLDHGRRRLDPLLPEPRADDVRLVVVAQVQLRPVDVADAVRLRRVRVDVVDVVVRPAHAPPGQAPHHRLLVDVEHDHRGDAAAEADQHVVEGDRLRLGAGEAVEEDARVRVAGAEPLLEHRDDEVVGHEVAARHHRLRLEPERRAVAHGRAQHVAGGDVGQPAGGRDAGGLGALARARRAHEDQV
jgi:hypothetical protein